MQKSLLTVSVKVKSTTYGDNKLLKLERNNAEPGSDLHKRVKIRLVNL